MIGVISEQKGTEFIVDTFLRCRNPDARLLIVGGREKAFIEKCRKLAENDNRIIFWGEESEIMKVYAISDYVLRGESFPCVGRTIYEGLYAGCRVIVPGDAGDSSSMFEIDQFRDMIYNYPPRDRQALQGLFEQLTG